MLASTRTENNTSYSWGSREKGQKNEIKKKKKIIRTLRLQYKNELTNNQSKEEKKCLGSYINFKGERLTTEINIFHQEEFS